MHLPEIFEFNNSKDFFSAFVALNKRKSAVFSFQKAAEKLKWPKSLLHELAAGQTKLSLRRALEFSKSLKMNSLATERLIYMVLREVDSTLALFANKQLSLEYKELAAPVCEKTQDLTFDHAVLVCMAYFTFFKSFTSYEHILSAFPNCRQLSAEQLKKSTALLEAKGKIKIQKDRVLIIDSNLFGDDFEFGPWTQVHIDFAMNFINYCQTPIKGPATFHSFYIRTSKAEFEMLRKRLMTFRNWVLEQDLVKDKYSDDDLTVQVDLNLFPAMKT